MKQIGLISDTHNYLHPKIFEHFKDCDEIWHAGDIGNIEIVDKLKSFKRLRAVYGNMDGQDIRIEYPESIRFLCEDIDVLMTHIGGYPKNYSREVMYKIKYNPPTLFISGHSHILKVMYDKDLKLLHINPGAAGRSGIHQVITLVKFKVSGRDIKDLKIIELEKK